MGLWININYIVMNLINIIFYFILCINYTTSFIHHLHDSTSCGKNGLVGERPHERENNRVSESHNSS